MFNGIMMSEYDKSNSVDPEDVTASFIFNKISIYRHTDHDKNPKTAPVLHTMEFNMANAQIMYNGTIKLIEFACDAIRDEYNNISELMIKIDTPRKIIIPTIIICIRGI